MGVILELADRLKSVPSLYTLRFLATSGEEEWRFGSIDAVKNMDVNDRVNTLLVVNLDSLFIGDRLYFNSGPRTRPEMAKLTRDRALEIAKTLNTDATTNPGLHPLFAKGTGCCNDADSFDEYGIPVLSVEATNWSLGNFDGYQQVGKNKAFPDGYAWHNPQLDNIAYIDNVLLGRVEARSRDVVNILVPLLTELLTNRAVPEALNSKENDNGE